MSETAEVNVQVNAISLDEKNVLLEHAFGECWIAKSQIENLDELGRLEIGDAIDIEIPQWLAEKEGMV